jgi:hypothetical protein
MCALAVQIEWLGWSMSAGIVSSTGLRLHDVRFKGERIAYEIALQEALAGEVLRMRATTQPRDPDIQPVAMSMSAIPTALPAGPAVTSAVQHTPVNTAVLLCCLPPCRLWCC